MFRSLLGAALLGAAWLATAARSAGAAADESWDAVFIANVKVGWIHVTVKPVVDRGKNLVNVQFEQEIDVNRQAERTRYKVRYGTIETPEGQVLRLDTRMQTGNGEFRASGDAIRGEMKLIVEAGGQRQGKVIPWGPEVRGPYAAEMSLSRSPMKPGETRDLKMFIAPGLNVMTDLKLMARGLEEVELGGHQKRSLLRIDSKVTMPDGTEQPELGSTYWVDPAGQVLKQYVDVFGGMACYRTTESGAKSVDGQARLDIVGLTFIKVAPKIPRAESTRDVVYQVALKSQGGDPATLFPADRRQTIRPGAAPGSAILEVQTAGPDDGLPGPEMVDAQFLRANPMINSEDPEVIRLANRAVLGVVGPWAKAVAIEEWVFKNLRDKNFKTSFASATEVAKSLAGDCTEHSVLTAAMCRAVGVPARVIVGLVYVEDQGAFGYHMWNEVYVNRRWVAIDATSNQAQVDATHLKVADASLDGVSPYETFLSLARSASNLSLVPREIR